MPGLCKDCKHWSRDAEAVELGLGVRGDCELTHTVLGYATLDSTQAFAMDDEGHHAVLKTLPTFGCVQFQPASSE